MSTGSVIQIWQHRAAVSRQPHSRGERVILTLRQAALLHVASSIGTIASIDGDSTYRHQVLSERVMTNHRPTPIYPRTGGND